MKPTTTTTPEHDDDATGNTAPPLDVHTRDRAIAEMRKSLAWLAHFHVQNPAGLDTVYMQGVTDQLVTLLALTCTLSGDADDIATETREAHEDEGWAAQPFHARGKTDA